MRCRRCRRPTDYGRPTTTFTTEPVRTTQPPTSLPQQPVTGGDVAADSATSEIPEGIMVDPLTGQWTYQIVAGDVPGKLAERFGVAVDDLAAANVNTPGYSSYLIGAVVIIPHGDPSPIPAATPGSRRRRPRRERLRRRPPHVHSRDRA